VSKKDTLVENAQKFLQKGLTEKAVACYQEALNADPGDQRVRQRLAELYAKCRRVDDARKELEIIGKNLTANGFYLKAIAVYKQIEKLFPEDISLVLTLASLNEKHGLTANALAEYKRAYDYYSQLQNNTEVLKILESMQRIDGQNPNIKLKFAEVLFQQGKVSDALEAFQALGGLLIDRHDETAFMRLTERVAQLFPDCSDFTCIVLEHKINGGGAAQSVSLLESLIAANPLHYPYWRLLAHAYRYLGNRNSLKTACQRCIQLSPDELWPREALINSLLEDQDVQTVLPLLDESEQLFLVQGAAGSLKEIYLKLNDVVPINLRILKGCVRACEATGNDTEAASFAAKIGSLAGLEESVVAFDKALTIEDVEQPIVETDEMSVFEVPSAAEPDEAGPHDYPADDFYEIDVELDDEFGYVETPPVRTWFETVTDIFDSIQTDAGKVRFGEKMESNDFQSQYDLGLAFYDMGLYDEAIASFRQAAGEPDRRVACLILQGACLRGKGALLPAENALRALLDSPALSDENMCALKYELALTCAAQGKDEEAQQFFEEVKTLNPAFRDVGARLSETQERGLDFDDDELLGFDLK